MKFVVAGSVSTSQITVEALQACGANIVGLLGLSEAVSRNVSGYVSLRNVAERLDIPYFEFTSINDAAVINQLSDWAPDYVFVVGLSQLVRREFLRVPAKGVIGFHPTRLPEGRGRAPIAWLTLDVKPGAATLFSMDEGTDSGQILEQVPFDVSAADYAGDVLWKAEMALREGLARLIPELIAGTVVARDQPEEGATFYGKRAPEDGVIDWEAPAEEICRLVHSASRPHPGAYTFFGGRKLIIWRVEIEHRIPVKGVIGRIVGVTAEGYRVIQTGSGLISLVEVELPEESGDSSRLPGVGVKLGINAQDTIYELGMRVAKLELAMEELMMKFKAE